VASSCNICVGVWRASAFFKQCVGHHKIVKCHLPWFSWSVLTCSSWLLGMCTQRHNNWNLLDIFSSHFFSLFFSSSALMCQCIKVFYHFFSFNLVFILFITIYFIFYLFLLIFFFNFVPRHLVSFNFYIKFGPYSFDCCFFSFLNWILFSISFLNIWFQFIFMWNLIIILFTAIYLILDPFYYYYFSISSLDIYLIENFASLIFFFFPWD